MLKHVVVDSRLNSMTRAHALLSRNHFRSSCRWAGRRRSLMLKCAGKQAQLCCSHKRTKEMLNDITSNVWWKLNFVQHHTTSCNMMDKRVQHVALNNVEQCWNESWCCIRLARASIVAFTSRTENLNERKRWNPSAKSLSEVRWKEDKIEIFVE